jgi:tetratricopeptide (TPR) repeat protein
LRSILKDNPSNERATYFLGTLAYQENKLTEAEDLFEKTLVLRPDLEPAYYDLAGVKVALNKPDDALAVIERARGRFKKSFLMEFCAAIAQVRAKRFDVAVRHFTEAEVLAGAGEPERLNALFYFQFGAACERRGDFAEAEKLFRKSLALSPDFAEALNYLGYMWADRGEHLEEAQTMIEKAVKLEPENGAYLDSLGWVLFKLGRSEEALDWLRQAIEHNEEPDATLFDHLGDVHAALHQLEKAREAWRKSLAVEANEAVRKKVEALPVTPDTPEP